VNRDELRINSFLRLGYFCDYQKELAPIDFSGIDKRLYEKESRDDLVRIGVDVLHETFAGLWDEQREHVVPLSGGLDSRLILGALLELSPAEQIQTYTYGVPGSYDYDIANSIAKEFGTQHLPMPLSDMQYSKDIEIEAAKRTDCQGVLFHHPPFDRLDHLYSNVLFWSGYVGDAVAGSYFDERPSKSIQESQIRHLKNRTLVRSTTLHRCSDRDFLQYMSDQFINPDLLTYDEQVLFSEAVPKFTAPLVLFSGYEFVTPFINTPWMDFMLSVPNTYRQGQELMIDISRKAYPRLFNMPSKNRLGHNFDTSDQIVSGTFWVNRVRKALHQFIPIVNWPNVQYNDFNEGIRGNPSLRDLVRRSIDDLRRRGMCDWIDFDLLWRRHDRRIRNHGDALIILASLELVTQANESGRVL